MYKVSIALKSFTSLRIFRPVCRTTVATSSVSSITPSAIVEMSLLRSVVMLSLLPFCAYRQKGKRKIIASSRERRGTISLPYNLFRMRSITQLVVVALKPSQVQMLFPCRCSTTACMSGNCTWGGFSGWKVSIPLSVCSIIGS